MKTFSNKSYSIEFLSSEVLQELANLSNPTKNLIQSVLEERLMIDPLGFGKPLRYTLKGYRVIRVGNYRIIYRIEPHTHTVLIVAIEHQKNIYTKFKKQNRID